MRRRRRCAGPGSSGSMPGSARGCREASADRSPAPHRSIAIPRKITAPTQWLCRNARKQASRSRDRAMRNSYATSNAATPEPAPEIRAELRPLPDQRQRREHQRVQHALRDQVHLAEQDRGRLRAHADVVVAIDHRVPGVVGDEQFGLAGQGQGDAGTLALASRQLERVVVCLACIEAARSQQESRTRSFARHVALVGGRRRGSD